MTPSRTRRARVGAVGVTVALALTAATPALADRAEQSEPEDAAPAAPVDAESADAATGTRETLPLITGDVVTVTTPAGSDEPILALQADGPSRGVGTLYEVDGSTHLLPAAAAAAVSAGVAEEALFDVDGLIEDGAADSAGIPVIVQGEADVASGHAANAAEVRDLSSIDAVGVSIAADQAEAFWSDFTASQDFASADGTDRIWYDAPVSVTLADSVPQINAPQVWDLGVDGEGVTVAVLDTGIDAEHPDLQGQILEAQNFTTSEDATDRHGHGTHVAATVAGTGAGNGAPGVAPGADILVGKVLGDDGNGQLSWILDGMEWAAESADVVNMSLGTQEQDDGSGVLSSAADALSAEHDVLFVVASGNDGIDRIGQPASSTSALTVGAVDKSDVRAGFSTTGPRFGDHMIKPELTAPGVGIVAARASGTSMGFPVDDLYTSAEGTSMATPHVAGAAALLLQAEPDLGAQELKSRLVASTAPVASAQPFTVGSGRLDALAALEQDLTASPSTLTLGAVQYREEGEYDPASQTSVLNNTGDEGITLSVTASGHDLQGTPIPAEALILESTEITVPAGGTADLTLAMDPNLLQRDRSYNGYVTLSDGTSEMRVAFSLFVEPLMYDLDLSVTDRNGEPAASPGYVAIFDEQSSRMRIWSIQDGQVTARLTPGAKTVQAFVITEEADGTFDMTVGTRAGVNLSQGDTEVEIDSRDGVRFVVDTEEESELRGSAVGFMAGGNSLNYTTLIGPDMEDLYLIPTGEGEAAHAETVVHSTWVEPADDLTTPSPFSYQLIHSFEDGIPADLTMEVDKADLAHTTAQFYERAEGATGRAITWNRRLGLYHYVTSELPIELGTTQEQWMFADAGHQKQSAVLLADTLLLHQKAWNTPQPGTRVEEWFKAVNNTRIDPATPGWFTLEHYDWLDRTLLAIGASAFPDSESDHAYTFPPTDTYSIAATRNGESFGQVPYWYATWEIPNEAAEWEILQENTRGLPAWEYAPEVSTLWSFETEPVTERTRLPMPNVEYEINGTGLTNTVPAGAEAVLDLTVAPWLPEFPAVDTVQTWLSYDDGETWEELALTEGEGDLYTGSYTPPADAEYVSVRTVATDLEGNSVDQTVTRAYGVAAAEPEPPVGPESVTRVAGDNRYESAAAISALHEPGVDTVYITTGEDYADALTGSALAAAGGEGGVRPQAPVGGPVLLTQPNNLPRAVVAELERLAPASITVLGGDTAVSSGVLEALGQYTEGDVTRLEGGDRYETAAAIAEQFGGADEVFVATGQDYPDALAAAARAGALDSPVLLVKPDGIPNATAAALDALEPGSIRLLGGTAAVDADVEAALAGWAEVTRVHGGTDDGRYGTAAALAQDYPTADVVFVSTGQDWPDALAGSAWAGAENAPMLLTQSGNLPAVTAAEAARLGAPEIIVLGGTTAITQDVLTELEALQYGE